MAKMGRPSIQFTEIHWNLFEVLCKSQCSKQEIAMQFGIDDKTLQLLVKKKYKKTFSLVFEQKRMQGFTSLRAKQYQVAMKGDRSMLIWLGKNWLGQKDQVEIFDDKPMTYVLPESMIPADGKIPD